MPLEGLLPLGLSFHWSLRTLLGHENARPDFIVSAREFRTRVQALQHGPLAVWQACFSQSVQNFEVHGKSESTRPLIERTQMGPLKHRGSRSVSIGSFLPSP